MKFNKEWLNRWINKLREWKGTKMATSLFAKYTKKFKELKKSRQIGLSGLLFAVCVLSILSLRGGAALSQDYAIFEENGKQGCKITNGKIVIPAKYDEILLFESDSTDKLCMIIDGMSFWYHKLSSNKTSKKYIIPFPEIELPKAGSTERDRELYKARKSIRSLEILGLFYGGAKNYKNILCVYSNGKYGFIDRDFKEITPIIYDAVNLDSKDGNLILIRDGSKYGYIDKTGKMIIPAIYEEAKPFKDGTADVKFKGTFKTIDEKGQEVSVSSYEDISSFSEGLAYFKKNGKYGYVNENKKEVIAPRFDKAWLFSDGMALVELHGKQGYINKDGKEIIPIQYDEIIGFLDGLSWVEKNGKYGFIDLKGREIIKVEFDDIEPFFSDGKVKAIKNGKTYYFDKTGRLINENPMPEEKIKATSNEAPATVTVTVLPTRLNQIIGRWDRVDGSGTTIINEKEVYLGKLGGNGVTIRILKWERESEFSLAAYDLYGKVIFRFMLIRDKDGKERLERIYVQSDNSKAYFYRF